VATRTVATSARRIWSITCSLVVELSGDTFGQPNTWPIRGRADRGASEVLSAEPHAMIPQPIIRGE
jgi:hypothetical protein